MAPVTLRAETSFMFVVLLVTTDARHRGQDFFVHTLSVACQTVESLVAAVQFEAGASVVGEVPELPVSNAMAFLALSPQPTLVHVAIFVAGVAVGRCLVFIEMSPMATLTGDRAMFADERILGVSIMVKGQGVPVVLAMTGLAFLAKIRSVDIFFCMAGEAIGRCLVFIQRTLMTTVTCRSLMIAFEPIGGITVMVEEQHLPVPFGVAPLALFPESSLMGVVLLVAGITVCQGFVFIEIPLMTRGARGGDMLPTQRVLGM